MITVWDIPVVASVEDIVRTLVSEVRANDVPLLRDVRRSVDNIMLTCPEHGGGREKNPSCGVSTVDVTRNGKFYPAGTVHCFRCDWTGDLPKLVSTVFGYRDEGMFGYKWIMERFVAVEIENRPELSLDMTRKYFYERVEKEEELVERSSNSVECDLNEYRVYHDYMFERKLTEKVIDYFDVGFDRSNMALTFPVHDLNGQVLFIQRRSVEGKKFLNQDDAEKGSVVYGLYQVYQNLSWAEELWICESPIDALTCWTHRVPAVALMGALATATQMRLLRDVPIRKIVLALDNPQIDEAGRKGMDKLRKILGKTKLVYTITYPVGRKDINELTPEEFDGLRTRMM